jgi:hypothetical protein
MLDINLPAGEVILDIIGGTSDKGGTYNSSSRFRKAESADWSAVETLEGEETS